MGHEDFRKHIRLYYGTNDAWILDEMVESMRKRLPGQVVVDQHECHHAFVMKDNEIMAQEVAEMIDCDTCKVDEKDNPYKRTAAHRLFPFVDWLF